MLAEAATTYAEWRRAATDERSEALAAIAAALTLHRDRLADVATREMGKLPAEAASEVEKCAWLARHYAEHLAGYLRPRAVPGPGSRAEVHVQPMGVVLGVMPWNFPYWQVARFAFAALACGNVAALKHAPNVQECAEALAGLIREATGRDLLVNLRVRDEYVAEHLIAAPEVVGVACTGSERAGRAVGAAASKYLKPSVLELGGSDAYLVLADADPEAAARTIAAARALNAGQSCISPKRVIVVDAAYASFAARLREACAVYGFRQNQRSGSGARELAPLARPDLAEELHRQVEASVAAGATALLGGSAPTEQNPCRYPFTLLADLTAGMPAAEEELFGPVIALLRAADEAEAIALANDTRFGLGAAVFTRNVARGYDLARGGLEAGAVVVNGAVASDPRLPFGGIKSSGYGRELAREGLLAFANVKTVVVST